MIKRLIPFACLLLGSASIYAYSKVLNIYAWAGEIPDSIVRQFENETHIKVNISTYENNETLFAKLRATKNPGYDVIVPSSYFVDRMRRLKMLEELDKKRLPNFHNINPRFLNPAYDPQNYFSIPFVWGLTGIFYNSNYIFDHKIGGWSQLWEKRFYNKLMLLDDAREVFSMALLSLGYSPNDSNPLHIKQAFLKLKTLMPNVKVFSTATVVSIIIDEDATIGMVWNGDFFKAMQENKQVHFIFPKEGFVIWVDNFAIPLHAPHKDNAYTFINFILRSDIAKNAALLTGFPTANLAAQKLLPENVRKNPVAYPSEDILKRGQFQLDLDEKTLALYEKYWEQLKMGG